VLCGGEFDGWDLEVAAGLFGGAKLLMAVEEQGGGSQYVRFRVWPHLRPVGRLILFGLILLGLLPALDRNWVLAATFGVLAFATVLASFYQCGGATAAFVDALEEQETRPKHPAAFIPAWLPQLVRRRPGRDVGSPAVIELRSERQGKLNATTSETP
jgi:hypothetical protein